MKINIPLLLLLSFIVSVGSAVADPPQLDNAVRSGQSVRDFYEPVANLSRSSSWFRQDLMLTEDSKRFMLDYARLLYNGEVDRADSLPVPEEVSALRAPIIIYAFDRDGSLRDRHRLDGDDSAKEKLIRGIERLPRDNPDVFLHLMVVRFTGRFPNFGIRGMFDNRVFEPMVTGLVYERHGKRVEVDPLEMVIHNMGSRNTRAAIARKLGIDPRQMPNYNDLAVEIYRVIHFGEAYPDRRMTNFHRGHSVFTAEDLDHDELARRLDLIGLWYSNNVIDGEVTYEYSPARRIYRNSERTMVRSTMATWILNRLAYHLGDPELKRLGEKVISYYLDHYFNIDQSMEKGRIIPSTVPLPNGNLVQNRYTVASFIAAAILERDDHPRRAKEMEMLMDWAMSFQRDDGVMWTQWAQSQYFMPGQLLLAVSYFYDATRDEKYRAFFEKTWNAYEGPLYDMMHLGNERYIPYAPAWFTQPLAQMYLTTGDNRYRDMVYAINDRVAAFYDHNARDQVYYDYDGCLAPKLEGYGNNSVTSAALESLVDAALVARKDGDMERLETYKKVIRRTTAFLLRLQFTPENTYYMRHRDRVLGGFKRDMVDSTLWMDNVWHLASAFMKIQENRLLDPEPSWGEVTE